MGLIVTHRLRLLGLIGLGALLGGTAAPLIPPAWGASPAAPAPRARSIIQAPFYRRESQALLVPYKGEPPRFRTRRQARPPALFVELEAASGFGTTIGAPIPRASPLTGWVLSAPAPGRVRLGLLFRQGPPAVDVFVDPSLRALVVRPALAPASRAQ
jgi:hypothetical protein